MSSYSTKTITRAEAEEMVRAVRRKQQPIDEVSQLTKKALDEELHEYVYSEEHTDIVGVLYNYDIK
jgi:PHD/YefM family antitoxin component YafN of YafNO toxin-antitoxin module